MDKSKKASKMKPAPVVLFVYKRKESTVRCLRALEGNYGVQEFDLIVFSDSYKNTKDQKEVLEVREYLNEYIPQSRFKSARVIKNSKNQGLAKSIITGVSSVLKEYGKAIIVEDDLVCAPNFLNYMNSALDYYWDDKRYGEISGYSYPMAELSSYDKDIFITHKADCWGWATWEDRWNQVDWTAQDYRTFRHDLGARIYFDKIEFGITHLFDTQQKGLTQSWAVRWVYHLWKNNQWTVYPTISLVSNDGFDGTGTNTAADEDAALAYKNNLKLDEKEKYYVFEYLLPDEKLSHASYNYVKRNNHSKLKRMRNLLYILFG